MKISSIFASFALLLVCNHTLFALPPGAQIPETQCTVVDDFRKAAGYEEVTIFLKATKDGKLDYELRVSNQDAPTLNSPPVIHLSSLDLAPWIKEVERRHKINPDWTMESLPFQLLGQVRHTLSYQFNARLLLAQYKEAFVSLQELQRINELLWHNSSGDRFLSILAVSYLQEIAEKYYQLCAIIPNNFPLIKELQKFQLIRSPEQMRQLAKDWMLKEPTAMQRLTTQIFKEELPIYKSVVKNCQEKLDAHRSSKNEITDEEREEAQFWHKEYSDAIQHIEQIRPEELLPLKRYLENHVIKAIASKNYLAPVPFTETYPIAYHLSFELLGTFDSLLRHNFETQNYLNLAKSALLLKIQPNDTAHLQNLINAFDGKPMTLDLDRMVAKIKQLPKLEHFTKGEPIKRERWDYFPLKLKLKTPEK